MTNWMTGAGLALIAGGLATLISFRSILFGGGGERGGGRGGGRDGGRGGERDVRRSGGRGGECEVGRSGEHDGGRGGRSGERGGERVSKRGRERGGEGGAERGARRRAARAVEPPQRQAALPASRAAVADEADGGGRSERRGRRGRRRALVAASAGGEVPWESDEDDRGGLASIGLADEDDDEPFAPEASFEEEIEVAPDPVPARADRYGDRVEGWVRPEYQDPPDEPRPGEYWTPIPVDLAGDPEPSAKGYGWPRPVERLPAVPDYEPATGFDLIPISEPTEVVPTWAMNDDRPGRIRLPRSWNNRNEKQGPEKTEPRRPRPRPRPRPEQPADPSTVYVSRHAADPPARRE